MWQRGLIGSTAHARVLSQRELAFTSRREQLESMSSTPVHDPSIVTIEFSQLVAAFLEELSPVPTLKTTCRNRGRRRREGVGAIRRAKASDSKHNASYICPVCDTNYYEENQGQEGVQCCGSSTLCTF
ncbi:hypothetical protein TNCV_3433991 [Trichonephila clavipes]|nr:hypothetical protein TNCV_3433991 [Trichonephila clavipes]